MNSARSMFSTVLLPKGRAEFGTHPIVTTMYKRIFTYRPVLSCYVSITEI